MASAWSRGNCGGSPRRWPCRYRAGPCSRPSYRKVAPHRVQHPVGLHTPPSLHRLPSIQCMRQPLIRTRTSSKRFPRPGCAIRTFRRLKKKLLCRPRVLQWLRSSRLPMICPHSGGLQQVRLPLLPQARVKKTARRPGDPRHLRLPLLRRDLEQTSMQCGPPRQSQKSRRIVNRKQRQRLNRYRAIRS